MSLPIYLRPQAAATRLQSDKTNFLLCRNVNLNSSIVVISVNAPCQFDMYKALTNRTFSHQLTHLARAHVNWQGARRDRSIASSVANTIRAGNLPEMLLYRPVILIYRSKHNDSHVNISLAPSRPTGQLSVGNLAQITSSRSALASTPHWAIRVPCCA
jgi:hypothetical protein